MNKQHIIMLIKKILKGTFIFLRDPRFKIVRILIAGILIVLFVFHYMNDKPSAPTVTRGIDHLGEAPFKPLDVLTVPAVGDIPALHIAMQKDRNLRRKVEELWSYDTGFIFFNYRKVDSLIVEILFRWSGLNDRNLKKINTTQGVEYFLRKVHGMSEQDKVHGNPLLGPRPWPRLFTYYKVRLLMQGQARLIYDGKVTYDNRVDRFYIDGDLSKPFMKDFTIYTSQLSKPEGHINNLVGFIKETKGFRNLSQEDLDRVRKLLSKKK